MNVKKKHLSLMVGALLASASVGAEEQSLPIVVVKGQSLAADRSAFTVNVIEQETIRERHVSQLQELYREVPGISVRGLGLGGVADSITMRGFTGGGHGGDIGMAIDGISLNESMSHADGYADQNVIIPLEVERMTVFKGPSSVLYGNYSRAGTIAVESRKGGEYRDLDIKAGSHATRDVQAALGTRMGPVQANFAVQLFDTKGFREQSETRRATASGRLGFDLGGATRLAVSGRAHEGKWDSASYIPAARNRNADTRFDKDPNVQDDAGTKDFYTGRMDFSTPLADELRLLAFASATHQSFSRSYTRPTTATRWEQRLEAYERQVRGVGTSLNGAGRIGGRALNWVAGVEAYRETTAYLFKDALLNGAETALTTSGAKPYLNRDYLTRSVSAFGQAEWNFNKPFRPALGVRYDRFSGDCSPAGKEIAAGAGNPCLGMAHYDHASPKVGVRSTWSPMLDTRISVSEGFQLPSAAARYGASGRAVEPTRIRQADMGLTLKPARGALVDLSVFHINTYNEVRDLGGGAFENFGQTRRAGAELDLQIAATPQLDLSVALTWVDTKVLEHANAAVAGQAVPNVPEHTATVRGRYSFGAGWSADLAIQNGGGYPVTADNAMSLGGFTSADLTLAWERHTGMGRQRFFAAITNLADRAYSTSSLVSGGIQLYAPAPPRSIQIGMNISL
jgi:outer membrane receptor protein involved in Fe transport